MLFLKMKADFDHEKKRVIMLSTRSLERDLERLKADHATELEEREEKTREEISAIKRKQWVNSNSYLILRYQLKNTY